MIRTREVRAGALALLICAMTGAATAAETITVYAAGSLKGALSDLAESYESATGNTVSARYGPRVARFMELSDGNRQQINNTTDKRPDDCTVYTDVLKVAAEDQFKTVGYGPRIPVPHDLSD